MATDVEWTQLLAWLATFPGYVDPEKHVKLVHNQGARPSLSVLPPPPPLTPRADSPARMQPAAVSSPAAMPRSAPPSTQSPACSH